MAQNPNPSALDQDQIIRRVFDGANDKLRVDASVSLTPGSVVLDSTTSSVTIGDDAGTHATITTITTKKALDVNVANDINLIIDATNDSIAIENASGVPLAINADGSLNIEGVTETSFTGLKVGGRILEVPLTDAWTLLPTTALASRNALVIQNLSGKDMKINYINSVGYVGITIKNGGERSYAITDAIHIYGRLDTAQTGTIVVEEIA